MSTPSTSPAKIYIKKPQFRRLYLMYTTTLAQVAKDNYLDVKSLLILNPEIISANEPICHLFLTLPNRVNFNERDLKKKEETGATFAIVKDPLRPVSQRIRPKISEIFRLFVDFDHQTHKYLKEIRKLFQAKNVWPLEKGCELITHIDCWDESFVPKDLICGVKRSSYLNYRIGAYNLFTESVRKMGMFVRDMTYLFHYCFNRKLIKVLDYARTKPALQFADKFCLVLLERIDEYLFILMHFYQNSNGSYHDVVNYFRAHEFIEATFGEMLKYFSKKGGISCFTRYPDSFFVYDDTVLSKCKSFTDGVNGEPFNDQYIFDFSLDYSSINSDEKIREIANTLDENVRKFHRDIAGVQGIFEKSQTLYLHHTFSEVQLLIKGTETILDSYKGKGLWAEKLIMENELSRLRNNANHELDNILSVSELIEDKSLNRMVKQATIAAYAYFFGLSIHLVILEIPDQLRFVYKFYGNLDEMGREFRRHINTLLEIVEKNRLTPDEASVMLEKLYMELRPFQQEAIRVINSFRMIDTVVRTLLIFTCVCTLTWAASVVVESFLAGFSMASAVVGIGTFSSQVLAFTLSSRITECLLDERVVIFDSIGDYLKALGTNAILFMFFHAVSAVVKPMMKSFHLSTSVRAVQCMSNSITMIIGTTPVFVYQQYKRGQLSNKDEWVQFIIVQAILSAVCSGLLISVQGRMTNVEAAVRLESKAWGVNARYRWEKIGYEVRRSAIDKEINEIYLERDKIPPIYRNDFKLNETTAKQLYDAKMSVVNRSKKVLKALKSLNRDLRVFRKNVPVNRESSMDISPENEIEAMEYLINQAESRMQSITFTPNQNRAMADFVHNTLPKYLVDNKVNGLSMLGESGSFYTCQRIFKIIQKVPRLSQLDFKGNPLRAVDVPEESVFRNLPERYREGILRIQGKWEIDGKSGVAEITVFDLNAKGVVPRDFFQKRYIAEPLKEESSQIPLTITKKGIDVYIEYSNKEPEEIIKLLCDRPEELVWSQEDLAELTQEIQEIGLEGLKARGLKKLTVMRIQEHNYGLANRPAVFVGDPFYFLGIDNPVSAKEAIGYGKKSCECYQGNKFLIWQADINDLVEANWTNARKAFDEYVRWGKEWYDYSRMDLDKLSPSITGMDPFTINEQFIPFLDNAKKYGFLNNDFSSKLTPDQWEKAWEARKAVVPEEGIFDIMENEIRNKIKDIKIAIEKPEYGLGKLMERIGFFDLFSGDGRCRTYTGKQGVKEWLFMRKNSNSFKDENLMKLSKQPILKIFKDGEK